MVAGRGVGAALPRPTTVEGSAAGQPQLVGQEGEPVAAGDVVELVVRPVVELHVGVRAGGGVRVAHVLPDEEVLGGPLEEHAVAEPRGVVDGVQVVEEGEVRRPLVALEASQNWANQLPISASGASSTIVEMRVSESASRAPYMAP